MLVTTNGAPATRESWLKFVEEELQPYSRGAFDIPTIALWDLVLDAGSGAEDHGEKIDAELVALYNQYGPERLREGYLRKWLDAWLESAEVRGRGGWWITDITPQRPSPLSARANELLTQRYRLGWRLLTVEGRTQAQTYPKVGAWRDSLGHLLATYDPHRLETVQGEMF